MTVSSRDLFDSKQNEAQSDEKKFDDLILDIIDLCRIDSDIDIESEEEEQKRGEKIKNALFNNFIMLNALSKKFGPDNWKKMYKSFLKSTISADISSLMFFSNTFKVVIADLQRTNAIDQEIQAGISGFENFLELAIKIIIANEESAAEAESEVEVEAESEAESESDEKSKLGQEIEVFLSEIHLEEKPHPALLIESIKIQEFKIEEKQPELIIEPKEVKEPKEEKPIIELVIDYEANLHQYPKKNDVEKLTSGKTLTVGDMHGNTLKFIYILIRHQILDIDEEKYNELIKIYNTAVPKRGGQESDSSFEARAREYKKNMAKFDGIINDAFNKMDPAEVGKLRLIGDIISDRGENDYFTLKIFECIGRKPTSIIKEILIGNHDYEALIHIYNLNHPDKKIAHWFDKKEHAPFKQSFLNLIELIELKLVDLEWVTNTINNYFKPLLKLISYAREESANKDKRLSLYTHAPTKILSHLKEAISYFNIKQKSLDQTLKSIINNIDAINKVLIEAKEITEPNFRPILAPFFESRIEDLKLKNEEKEETTFPKKIASYYIQFISGHNSSLKTYQFLKEPDISLKSNLEKAIHFTEILKHTYTLDNLFGRSQPTKNEVYFNRLSSEPPSLQLMLSIETILPEIQTLLNNPEVSERFTNALALYEESKDHKEFQKNWKEATDNALLILKKPESPLVSHSLYPAILNPSVLQLIEIFDETNLKISFSSAEYESISAKLTPVKSAFVAISITPQNARF